jgi:cell division protein FtsQ
MSQQTRAADADHQDGNGSPAADRGRAARGRGGRPRDRWRAAFFGVLVLAIAGGAGWALLGSSLLVVRHVEVSGNRLVPAAEIRAAARVRIGAPLATVNTTVLAQRVERIPAVLSARVSRSWPDTLVISVSERRPALAVAAVGGFRLIDGDGVTVRFATRKPPGLPVLTGPPAVLRGSPAIRAAVAVLKGMPRTLRWRVRSVSAAEASAVTLRLAGGVTVVWGGPGAERQKAAELTVLLRTHARYFDVSDPNTAVTQG